MRKEVDYFDNTQKGAVVVELAMYNTGFWKKGLLSVRNHSMNSRMQVVGEVDRVLVALWRYCMMRCRRKLVHSVSWRHWVTVHLV